MKMRLSTDSSFLEAMYAERRRNFVSFGMSKSKALAMEEVLVVAFAASPVASSKTASPVK